MHITTSLINEHSKIQLDQAAQRGHQSILLSGASGLGLFDTARYLANQLGGIATEVKPIDRATEKIDVENGKILVPLIRDLHEITRSKSHARQVIIIHSAHTMTAPAQGAFLKLLEEPNEGVHFVLLSEHPSRLLPTILSRLTRINLRKLSSEQSNQILVDLGVTDTKKRQQIMFMADGLPLQIQKLATDNAYFQAQVDIMTAAKQLVQSSTYDKLVAINKYKDSRDDAINLVDKAIIVTKKALSTQPSSHLVKRLDQLISAKEDLQANSNIRLTLMESAL